MKMKVISRFGECIVVDPEDSESQDRISDSKLMRKHDAIESEGMFFCFNGSKEEIESFLKGINVLASVFEANIVLK